MAFNSFGAKCVFSSEWDKEAQETYNCNFKETPHGDITKINAKNIPDHDILCAGFPCQPFSISGKQKGFEDVRGTLFFDILRIIKYRKPSILLLENVKRFETHDEGRTLAVVKNSLTKLGYVVFYKVLNSGDFGVAQKRERLYIVCFHKSLNITTFEFPNPIKEFKVIKDIVIDYNVGIDKGDIKLNKSLVTERSRFPVRVGIVGNGGQGERIYHENGQAITLSAYGGGVGAKTGLYLINNKIRKLQPRECARVMGFPDSFKIHASDTQAYKQFGNGVVINVLQHIIKNIIKELKN